jgi:major membrane immunogen (membrane-anchored lipoprotein)
MGQNRAIARVCALLIAVGCLFASGCAGASATLQDGYYTAQVAEPDHGWTEFVTICVHNDKIVTVEFQAKTDSGFIKAWDMDYMREMNASSGTYPNEYARVFTRDFLEKQSPDIDALTGATESYINFKQLVAAAMEQAKKGDRTVRIVDIVLPEERAGE